MIFIGIGLYGRAFRGGIIEFAVDVDGMDLVRIRSAGVHACREGCARLGAVKRKVSDSSNTAVVQRVQCGEVAARIRYGPGLC
ncbi:MAG: hypothetical protein NVS3B29_00620 [Candidatus Saccharimonadales bacterium]